MRIYTKLYLHWVKEQNMGGYTQEFGSLRLSRLLRSLSRVYDSCWDWEQGLVCDMLLRRKSTINGTRPDARYTYLSERAKGVNLSDTGSGT